MEVIAFVALVVLCAWMMTVDGMKAMEVIEVVAFLAVVTLCISLLMVD